MFTTCVLQARLQLSPLKRDFFNPAARPQLRGGVFFCEQEQLRGSTVR